MEKENINEFINKQLDNEPWFNFKLKHGPQKGQVVTASIQRIERDILVLGEHFLRERNRISIPCASVEEVEVFKL